MYRHHRRTVRPAPGQRATINISLLGGFRVVVDGRTTDSLGWAQRSAGTLVKILALAPGHCLHRDRVLDLLWPNEPPDRVAPRLYKAAHFARRAANRADAVVLRDENVWLFPGSDVIVDVTEFEHLARIAIGDNDPDVAKEALSWYDGELLPGDRYEEWALDRRELLHLRCLDVLRVAGEWRELVELDPTDEQAHVELMNRHLAVGRNAAARSQYDHLKRVLERDLDVEPGEAARDAHQEAGRSEHERSEVDPLSRVSALLAELADLVKREGAVLEELAAMNAAPPLHVVRLSA